MSGDAQHSPPAESRPAVSWMFRWVEHVGTTLATRGNRPVSVHLVGVVGDSLVTIKEVENGIRQDAQEALAQSQMLKLKSMKRPKFRQWPLCDYADVQQFENKKFIVSKYYPCMSLESLFPLFPSPLSSNPSSNNNDGIGPSPSGNQPRFTRFVPSLAKSILHDVLRGLNELHNARLAHGNLRPSSVLVTCCLHAKLDNIGFMSTETPLSDPLLWIWCAPEITELDFPGPGQSFAPLALSLTESEWLERNQRADIFSFGLLVYFLLSGVRPFHQLLMSAAGELQSATAAGTEPLEFRLRGCRARWSDFVRVGLEVLCADSQFLSAELKELAKRCLSCDPLRRPSTTELLLDEALYFCEREERVAEFVSCGTTGKEIVVPRTPRVTNVPSSPTSPHTESVSGTEYSQAEELHQVGGQMDRNEATEYIFFVCFRNGFVAAPPRTGVVPAVIIEQLAEATKQSDALVIREVRALVRDGYVRRCVPMNPYLMQHTRAHKSRVLLSPAGSIRPSDNTTSCLASCSSTSAGTFLQTFVIPFDSPISEGFFARESERARHPWRIAAIRATLAVVLVVVVIVVLVKKSS